jgi:Transketolase, thiamine diphosphate binding domain
MVQLAINTIRTLSIDAVQAAKSCHPGTPSGIGPIKSGDKLEARIQGLSPLGNTVK